MNLETLTQAGITLDYCTHAVVPEIPRVQDVLFAMRLSDEQYSGYFEFCRNNHSTYVVNVGLVIAAVGHEVLNQEGGYDEVAGRRIIAHAIVELCPSEARCIFNGAYVAAQEELSGTSSPVREMNRDEMIANCSCPHCVRRFREESAGRCR